MHTSPAVAPMTPLNGVHETTHMERLTKPSRIDKRSLAGLAHFQKTLLITDGTVTELLEFYLNDKITAVKIYEELEHNIENLPLEHRGLLDRAEDNVMLRKVLLQGAATGKNWLFAESSVLVDNLPTPFRNDLLSSSIPIGHLWFKHRLETFKSDYTIQTEAASQEVAERLSVPLGSEILSRTYCVYSDDKLVMIITEKFSKSDFVE